LLVKISDTEYQGKVGGVGAPAFTVAIDGTSGEITVTQHLTLDHPTAGAAHDDGVSMANVLHVVRRLTDSEGDFVETTSQNALGIRFEDGGPVVAVNKAVDDNSIVLATQDAQTEGNDSDTASSTADFSGLFSWTKSGGADGEASSSLVYSLGLGVAEGQPS